MSLIDSPGELLSDSVDEAAACELLRSVNFEHPELAFKRLHALPRDAVGRKALGDCLPMLLHALSDAATPDGSLVNFERFVQCVEDRNTLFGYLASYPRAVEILIKLFVGSQFLTEILLRNPDYLAKLTNHKRLAEFKSRDQFREEAEQAAALFPEMPGKLDALRRCQHWELLRIGACDAFGLLDLKSVTVQLSLLTDSIVQACLSLLAEDSKLSLDGFVVLAFGKLGGEELNYSSDIDLVFLADRDAAKYWPLGQKLIKALTEATGEGFLYRVDMRLRPWGKSGALVNTVDSHWQYLQKHGRQWEKQALLKARPIAGSMAVGQDFLRRARPLMFGTPIEELRESVREMKERIEADLVKQGRKWGEVKAGTGSIRDVEFTTQFLQMAHGGQHPEVLSFNTLDGLVRLADFGFIQADEYRQLTSGYVFLRTVEHALQLMHHKQTHSLPDSPRELAYLARRLDYPDGPEFLLHYERHCSAIRRVFERYVGGQDRPPERELRSPSDQLLGHLEHMEPSYVETFSKAEIARHAKLLKRLSSDHLVEILAQPLKNGHWQVTLAGFDLPGDLSMICGLLFVYGFNIIGGNVFTEESFAGSTHARTPGRTGNKARRRFVNVFEVRPPQGAVLPEVWQQYREDLVELLNWIAQGEERKAQGHLAKRMAAGLRAATNPPNALFPVDIEIDNKVSEHYSVLHIRGTDTIGFLYELSNALALAEIDVARVIVSSTGESVFDTLFVTDRDKQKITDETRLKELRAAVVLIKHFTHLLPGSPNPETALLQFRELLEESFKHATWYEELSSLNRFDVLDALARLLGVSTFLWEDFLRLQHENLFPVVTDTEALAYRKPKADLEAELNKLLDRADNFADRTAELNAFKDREMFRTDLRHITGCISGFEEFSEELTDVADAVVEGATQICSRELQHRFGVPRLQTGEIAPLAVCALGKCGGRELGYASDIELMFLYEEIGQTDGAESITVTEYYQRFVELFRQTIKARQEGIFQVDLRLRPYGRAGSLAVSLEAFQNYFGREGAAWPYERQALVKLRPIAGDKAFGNRIVAIRDGILYTGEPFDVVAMRGMREKQVLQLVQAETINAKLSPGGLVDCEYLVQGLQITHGHADSRLRTTNTLEAMHALADLGIIPDVDYRELRDAYIFFRRLIDALRMVRGHAKDLTVPPPDSEAFEFLSRRLGYGNDTARLQRNLNRASECIQELSRLLDSPTT